MVATEHLEVLEDYSLSVKDKKRCSREVAAGCHIVSGSSKEQIIISWLATIIHDKKLCFFGILLGL